MALPEATSSPKRRWRRFSLRGVLVLMTITCTWLAVVGERARKQDRAVRKLRAVGEAFRFDYNVGPFGGNQPRAEPTVLSWFGTPLGEEFFRKVVSVNLTSSGSPATDDDLASFEASRSTRKFDRRGESGL